MERVMIENRLYEKKILQIAAAHPGWYAKLGDHYWPVAVWVTVEDKFSDKALQRVTSLSGGGYECWSEFDDENEFFDGWHYQPDYVSPK